MRGATVRIIACLIAAATAHLAGADGGDLVLLPSSRLAPGSTSSLLLLPWGGTLPLQEIHSTCRRVPLPDGAVAVVEPGRDSCGDYARDRSPLLPAKSDLVLSADGTFLDLTVDGCLQRGDIVYFRRAQRLAFCVAALSSARTFTLTVGRAGAGSGTVTSTPAGINCGSLCSAAFDEGSDVSLAAAATSGSVFTGWSGDCTGTGSCVVTMSTDRAVTATFTLSAAIFADGFESSNTSSWSDTVQ